MRKNLIKFLAMTLVLFVSLTALVACDILKKDKNEIASVNVLNIPEHGIYAGHFNEANIQLEIVFKDNSTQIVPLKDSDISKEQVELLNTPGTHHFAGTYEGFEYSYTLEIKSPTCVITFINRNDEVVKSITYNFINNTPQIIPPTAEEMEVPGYRFTGDWDNDFREIKKDTVIKGIYESKYPSQASDNLIFKLNPDQNSYSLVGSTCEDKEIVIPSTYNDLPVTRIEDWSWEYYWYSNFTSIWIPDSVSSIGTLVFTDSINLTEFHVDENNKHFTSIDGNLYSKDGQTLVRYAIGKPEKTFEIPNKVTVIRDDALAFSPNLTSIIIPNSVTSICDWAFEGCSSLTSVVIPDSVTSISDYTFYYCDSLTSVTIGNSVTSIGYDAFYGCSSLTSVAIGNSVTSIGDYAFYECSSLTDVYYTGSAEEWAEIEIGYSNENLTNVTIHYNYIPEE